jgi:hypothetical protein
MGCLASSLKTSHVLPTRTEKDKNEASIKTIRSVHNQVPSEIIPSTTRKPRRSDSVVYRVMPTEDELREKYILDQSLSNSCDSGELHFRILLDEPLAQELLENYTRKLQLFHHYSFWLDFQKYKELDDATDITILDLLQMKYDKAHKIYQRYIVPNPINCLEMLSSEEIKILTSSFKSLTSSITKLTINHPLVAGTMISKSSHTKHCVDSIDTHTVTGTPTNSLDPFRRNHHSRLNAPELSMIREISTDLESFHDDGHHTLRSNVSSPRRSPKPGSSPISTTVGSPQNANSKNTGLRIKSAKDIFTSSAVNEECAPEMSIIEEHLNFISNTFTSLQTKCFGLMYSEIYLATFLQQGRSLSVVQNKLKNQLEGEQKENPPRSASLDLTPTTDFLAVLDAIHQKYNHVSIDDFEYFKKLGEGGYGVVLHCRRKSTGKHYAMKVLLKVRLLRHHRRNPDKVYMEKDLLASLAHPFVINLAYAFQTTDYVMLVTELADAGDLDSVFMNDMDIPAQIDPTLITEPERDASEENMFYTILEKRVKFYMAETVLALGYLHSKGLIYRDLKPQNILLCSNGHIKLADLGGVMDNDGKWSEAEQLLLHPKQAELLPSALTSNSADRNNSKNREARMLMNRVLSRLSTISPPSQNKAPSEVNTDVKPKHRNSYLFFVNGNKSNKVSPSTAATSTKTRKSIIRNQPEKEQKASATSKPKRKRQSVMGTSG